MTTFVLRRLALSIVTLFLLLTIVFVITNIFPGDVGRLVLGPFAPQDSVDIFNERIGANDTLMQQYLRVLQNTATFDYGNSYQFPDTSVNSLLWPAAWRSTKLVLLGLLFTLPISIAAGMYAARKRNTPRDRGIVTLGLASSSIPDFVMGVTLQYLIGVKLGWLPVLGTAPRGSGPLVQLEHLLLPAISLAIVYFGYIARMTRAGTIAALDADYTRTARMKGLSERAVMRGHVMRNALQPTVSVVGTQIGYMLSGIIGIEIIFNYPGLGRLIFSAVTNKDFPVLTAGVIFVGIIFMIMTLLADLLIAWMNPRARQEVGR